MPWTTQTISIPYQNPWLRLEHHQVLNPAGNPGIYGLVRFQNLAIGVVPLDDDDHTYLVGQYRYALDAYSWEIPEGGCPLGTDPLATAKRELQEETGLTAQRWTRLQTFHLSNSVTDEYGEAFLAEGLTQGQAAPEDTEELQLRRLPLNEAVAMTLDGRITDAVSIMALQRVALLRSGYPGARPTPGN